MTTFQDRRAELTKKIVAKAIDIAALRQELAKDEEILDRLVAERNSIDRFEAQEDLEVQKGFGGDRAPDGE